MRRLFLDSSVLFTAVNSPTGGAAKLFTLSNIRLIVSPLVLSEVERNVRNKLESYHLDRFFLLTKALIIIDQFPDVARIHAAGRVIHSKDAAILAEAKFAACDILVSLDRKHFFTKEVRAFLKPKRVMTPKEIFVL